jgi:hypothetical protein
LESSLHDWHDESKRGSVDEVNELCVQEGLETISGSLGRILESLEQDRNDSLNLGVPDDAADDLQGLGSGLLDFVMRVAENFNQFGHDGRKTG